MGDRPNPRKGLTALQQRVEDSLTFEQRVQLAYARSRKAVFDELGASKHVAASTPSSRAIQNGEVRAFMKHLDEDRGQLCLGDYTDDELASSVFIHGNMGTERNAQAIMEGELPSIVYLMAAKERIRWLSRHLDASLGREVTLIDKVRELEARLEEVNEEQRERDLRD